MLDAVLDRTDSSDVLDRISRTTLFLIPLDETRLWYRYHRLLTEYLPAELERREEGQRAALLRRAATWHERRGLQELALEYAIAAGDEESAARLIVPLAQPTLNSGRAETLQRWFSFFDRDDAGRRHPRVAALGAIVFSLEGESERADRWLATGRRATIPRGRSGDETTALLAQASLTLCQDGPAGMLRDAETAVSLFPEDHQYRVASMTGLGIALALDGRADAADVALAAAIDAFDRDGRANNGATLALLHRAWIAIARGDWTSAVALVSRGRHVAADGGLTEQAVGCALAAIGARIAIHHGATEQARLDLAHAQQLRPMSGYAVPWLAVRLRLDLARVLIALGDAAGGHTMLREIDDILVRRPLIGALADEIASVRARVHALPTDRSGASALTVAELRLLPLLTTHLSFPEIGRRLYISRNTVKTQAKSIYRKLDVDSRSAAVSAAIDQGLLEAIAAPALG
jgi:LuxR family maltose regulon positive regulatory protein